MPFGAGDPVTWATALFAVLFLACFVNAMVMLVRKWTTEVGVTSHRFVEKYGVITLRSNEIAVPNIEGVRVNQGVLGRILGYGKVRIEGTGDDSVLTPTIADPVGFVRAIQTAKEHQAGKRWKRWHAGATNSLACATKIKNTSRRELAPRPPRPAPKAPAAGGGDGHLGAVSGVRFRSPWTRHAAPPGFGGAATPGRCLHSAAPAGYRPGRRLQRDFDRSSGLMPMPVSVTL